MPDKTGLHLDLPAPAPAAPAAPPPRTASSLLDLGLTLAAMGARAEAIATLRSALAAKPGIHAAWRALADLLAEEGDAKGAREAQEMLAELGIEPPRGIRTPSDGKIAAAERSIRELIGRGPPGEAGATLRAHLRRAPTDVAALRILAEIGVHGGHLAAAEKLLARVLELAPGYALARHNYAYVLIMQGKAVRALEQLDRLLAEQPRRADLRTMRAQALTAAGRHDAAIGVYEGLKRDFAPKEPTFFLGYGNALKYAGRRDDSVAAYRQAIAVAPGSGAGTGEAYWALANLKNAQFGPRDIAAMQSALAGRGLSTNDRVHFHYALGRALEQEGDYSESFVHYAQGAKLRRAENGYDAQAWRAEMRRSARFFTPDFFEAQAGRGWGDGAPIFIVGLPRSGSTLIEQILASHSEVEGTQELPEIGNLVRTIGRSFNLGAASFYPERLARMDAQEIAELGARYIANTRFYRKSPKPYYIDKMPANWAYAGLIRTILPNARIIDARRDPMASCFSAFKQLFGGGADYSYDLHDLGMYYNDYVEMMAHMDAVQPGRIYRVVYENMVEDTEAEIGRLLAFCGLEVEPACLRFWESKRAVSTPSAEQVRQPIYREGLDQWRHYEPWLGDLKLGLADKE
jgi:tetratricopeptide (TPR) repeat protein